MTEIFITRASCSAQEICVLLESSVEPTEPSAGFRDLSCQRNTGMIGSVNLLAV